MKENKDLEGKIIIVTGSTQGVGEGIAGYLSEMGAKGLIICGRNEKKGNNVVESLRKAGTSAYFVKADLTDESDCRMIVRKCDRKFGRIDGLVNAAGDTSRGGIDDATIGVWDNLFDVNVRAPFILIQETVKVMKREKTKGSIVNIISISSHGGQPFLTAYCASKGALTILTKNVANSLKYDRIRVNGINIGWTYTEGEDKVQKKTKPDNWLETAESEAPFKRILRPIDVAKLVSYLLSDDSEMMTGSIIDFDQQVIGTYGDKG